jgi:hypothetical protein
MTASESYSDFGVNSEGGGPSLARVHYPCRLRSGEHQSSNLKSRCSAIGVAPLDAMEAWS